MSLIEHIYIFTEIFSNLLLFAFFISLFLKMGISTRNIRSFEDIGISSNNHNYILVVSYLFAALSSASHPDMDSFHFIFAFVNLLLAGVMYLFMRQLDRKRSGEKETFCVRFLKNYGNHIKIT